MLTPESFVGSLQKTQNVNAHYAFIDSCVARRNIQTLRDLFARISEECSFDPINWAPRAACERIIEALILADGYEYAATGVELALSSHWQGKSARIRLENAVSKLVAAQSPAVIDKLLQDESDLEISALILHEAILRNKLTQESQAAQDTSTRLVSQGHPLSILPLTLLDLESNLLLPNYTLRSSSTGIPFGPYKVEAFIDPIEIVNDVVITETTTPERTKQISTVVQNWEHESNGQTEARVFTVSGNAAMAEIPIPLLLPKLGLDCLRPADVGAFQDNMQTSDVFSVLFSAASTGGAYNYGEFGAYGRLWAWRSLAGLTGCSEDTPVTEVAMQASDCQWCLFSSANEWYYQVAWDIGIACVNPALNELAVLAATDTD